MSRPDLAAELDAVTRHLVLLAALVENLARSVRRPRTPPRRRTTLRPSRPSGCPPAPARRAWQSASEGSARE